MPQLPWETAPPSQAAASAAGVLPSENPATRSAQAAAVPPGALGSGQRGVANDGPTGPRQTTHLVINDALPAGVQPSSGARTMAPAPVRGDLTRPTNNSGRQLKNKAQPKQPVVAVERPAPGGKGKAMHDAQVVTDTMMDRTSSAGSHGGLTTVMLRNLPNRYTRAMLLEMLDEEGFAGKYDFVYLPIDFKTHNGLGYAFVDLSLPEHAERLRTHFTGFSRWCMQSDKICTVSWSHPEQQGLSAHINRYRNSPIMHGTVSDDWKPVVFSGGQRVPFPPPTRKLRIPHVRQLPRGDL